MVSDFSTRQNFVFSAAFKCSWESTASRLEKQLEASEAAEFRLVVDLMSLPDETFTGFYWIFL